MIIFFNIILYTRQQSLGVYTAIFCSLVIFEFGDIFVSHTEYEAGTEHSKLIAIWKKERSVLSILRSVSFP